MMNVREVPQVFFCEGDHLYGITHLPESSSIDLGILIVVGGPQTRVGSHRQFIQLARFLAQKGFTVFRFDYRGMGDSEGKHPDFEKIELDINAAIEHFLQSTPNVKRVAIWGLCDAASAAMLNAHKYDAVKALILLNPWARTESGLAKSYVKNYYLKRVMTPAFWRKVFGGDFKIVESLKSFLKNLSKAYIKSDKKVEAQIHHKIVENNDNRTLPERMFDNYAKFSGKSLFILSGNDLTAQEFKDAATFSSVWKQCVNIGNTEILHFPAANHTFSKREWKAQVEQWTVDWLKKL